MVTCVFKTKLPTLNEYINAERLNKFGAAAIKKRFTNSCLLEAKSQKLKLKKDKLYSLVVNWTVESNRADADNIYFGIKFLLDGLVNADILGGDGRKHIKNIHHNIETGKKYNIEVIFHEEK